MKTQYIESALRNATSHRAALARWQSIPIRKRLERIRQRRECKYTPDETLGECRATLVARCMPELSSPEAKKPILWISGEDDPEVLDFFAGREFLDHRGWFTDEYCEGTMETCAVRLRRFPDLIFYAVRQSDCDGIPVYLSDRHEIDYSDFTGYYSHGDAVTETVRELIRSCDSTTERMAEDERAYQAEWQREQEIAEKRETLSALRPRIRALIGELRTLCPLPLATAYPESARAVRAALERMLSERAELISEIRNA